MKYTRRLLTASVLAGLLATTLPSLAMASAETDFDLHVDAITQHISNAVERGDITPPQAARLREQINTVRTTEHQALYDYGHLSPIMARQLQSRLNIVNDNLRVFTGNLEALPPIS